MKNLIILLSLVLTFNTIVAQNSAGMALSLDGNDDYMVIPDDSTLRPTESITVEVWLRSNINMDTTSNLVQFVTKNDANSSQNHLDSWDIWYQAGQVHFGFRVEDSLANPLIATHYNIDFNANENYHIAGTYDKQNIKLFINGVLSSTRAENRNIQSGITEAVIGADSGTKLFFYNGLIDEIRIWKIARTQSQIQSTLHDTLSSAYYTSNDSGLVAYWRFDSLENLGINSGGIDDIRDLSINANHGDLEGNATLVQSFLFLSIEQDDLSKNINSFSLNQNYPNPFNPSTTIKYTLPKTEKVKIEVFNLLGQKIVTLLDNQIPSGSYEVEFNGQNQSSGIYYYRIEAGEYQQVRKMILLK